MASNKEVKDVVIFVASAISAFSDAMEDGQVSLKDMRLFIPLFSKGARAMGGLKDVVDELHDLDIDEIRDLIQAAKKALDLGDDELEQKIEGAIEYIEDLYRVYEIVKDALPS